MKQPSILLAQRYGAALRKHLKDGPQASMDSAARLGCQSVALGLETLDLAKIHEQTMIALLRPGCSAKIRVTMTRSAGRFFVKASAPIEETHRLESGGENDLRSMKETLGLRIEELAAASARLRGELAQTLLAINVRLLVLKRQASQEAERKEIGRELHDIVAPSLEGINVRLAALKKEGAINTQGLEQNIARTQRLVEDSVNIVHQFARELRPAVLDVLGLIPALHSFMKAFTERTGVRTRLAAVAFVAVVIAHRRVTRTPCLAPDPDPRRLHQADPFAASVDAGGVEIVFVEGHKQQRGVFQFSHREPVRIHQTDAAKEVSTGGFAYGVGGSWAWKTASLAIKLRSNPTTSTRCNWVPRSWAAWISSL